MRRRLQAKSVLFPAFAGCGAFLMFTLEPLVGRLLLPAYGGGFHVWTTCLMFFQGALLVGYLYAHLIAPRIGRLHLLVACLPLLFLPFDIRIEADLSSPIISILTTLLAYVAFPIGLLATTSVIAQSWFAGGRRQGERDPYWLYAASNAGSLAGLLSYPLLVEPLLGLSAQRSLWSVLYLGYLGLAFAVAPRRWSGVAVSPEGAAERNEAHTDGGKPFTWVALSAAPSVLLMAVTNAIAFDVGSVPLVWVIPLALYLTSFIFVFAGETDDRFRFWRRHWPELSVAGVLALEFAPTFGSWVSLGLHLLALFAVSMAAHAELYRLRPPASGLTRFYLTIAAGGWAGGIFTSLVAPRMFDRLLEYPIAILLLAGTLAWEHRDTLRTYAAEGHRLQLAVRAPLAVTSLAVSAAWILPTSDADGTWLVRERNSYGLYRVGEITDRKSLSDRSVRVRYMIHNGTTHGGQVLDSKLRRVPIGYYHRSGGLGDVMAIVPRPFRIGAIGLGAGTMTTYVERGDTLIYYEIDPDGVAIARRFFSYLADAPAEPRIVVGDARIELERDEAVADSSLDALVVDAFSGDAIPSHLLTREAIELYRRKVRRGGLIVFHITNRFYDLRPVLEAAREAFAMHAAYRIREGEALEPFESRTRYWAMSDDPRAIDALIERGWLASNRGSGRVAAARLWTDDYVNVLAPLWHNLAARQRPAEAFACSIEGVADDVRARRPPRSQPGRPSRSKMPGDHPRRECRPHGSRAAR